MKVKKENQVRILDRFVVWDNLYGKGEINMAWGSITDNTQISVVPNLFEYNPL